MFWKFNVSNLMPGKGNAIYHSRYEVKQEPKNQKFTENDPYGEENWEE